MRALMGTYALNVYIGLKKKPLDSLKKIVSSTHLKYSPNLLNS